MTKTNPDKTQDMITWVKHVHEVAMILKPHVLNERRAHRAGGKHADKVELLESQTKSAFKVWNIRPAWEDEMVSEFTYIYPSIYPHYISYRNLMRIPGKGRKSIAPSQNFEDDYEVINGVRVRL